MTTPVSLSNSEWLSNGGGGGSAVRQPENLRVQEASTEDISSIPMYDIYGQDKTQSQYQLKPNDMDYGYKGVVSDRLSRQFISNLQHILSELIPL